MVPRAVLMKSSLVSINTTRQNISKPAVLVNTARQVNDVYLKRIVARPMPKAVVNVVKGNNVNAVKASAYYEEIDGGYVAFGGNPKGEKITGKCTIKTVNLDFENVYFVRVKLIDENQVLLRVPRKDNMYSVDLKNIVPKGGLTCLFIKATSDESKLWHRRSGHLNFKTMNKLVKGNLVRGLPSKLFKNDQTCVACQKGKRHRASFKAVISECDTCHRNKADLAAYLGLLQPLLIPQKVWEGISMDFIDGSYVQWKDCDHVQVAELFMNNVYKLHRLPRTIVSDRDKVFTSLFWKSLIKMLKVELQMSSTYHPQTDGQTEAVNKTLECYLRCMTREKPKEWTQWLALAEFWYNTKFHSCTKTTPFEIVYGQTPPQYVTYKARECRVEAMDRTLVERNQAIQLLQFYLKRAQDKMKSMADKHRSEREFVEGDWVYLKLQPYRQVTVRQSVQHKHSPKYCGSFQVVKQVGLVAYKLKFPSNAQVHSVFHVSRLKKCKTTEATMGSFPHCTDNGLIVVSPIVVLDMRMIKRKNKVAVQLLIQWANCAIEDATWEYYEEIQERYPEFAIDH
ncbi:retrotransposable element Tf2 [Tanacetum coccineum]